MKSVANRFGGVEALPPIEQATIRASSSLDRPCASWWLPMKWWAELFAAIHTAGSTFGPRRDSFDLASHINPAEQRSLFR